MLSFVYIDFTPKLYGGDMRGEGDIVVDKGKGTQVYFFLCLLFSLSLFLSFLATEMPVSLPLANPPCYRVCCVVLTEAHNTSGTPSFTFKKLPLVSRGSKRRKF